jgi:hypothetical protein
MRYAHRQSLRRQGWFQFATEAVEYSAAEPLLVYLTADMRFACRQYHQCIRYHTGRGLVDAKEFVGLEHGAGPQGADNYKIAAFFV